MATGDILGVVMQSDVGASGGVAHQAVEPSLAPEFSASGTYAVGDFVMRNGVLYICSTAHTTAAWDASHFTAVNAGTYFRMIVEANAVANAGVAPGGFGLGGACTDIPANSDLNSYTRCGFYRYTGQNASTILNRPSEILNANMLVLAYSLTAGVTQLIFAVDGGSKTWTVRRNFMDGAWTAWEWENPPLLPNTEYRTTERFLGKPVYVKTIDLNAFNTNTQIPTGTLHGISNLERIIDLSGTATSTEAGTNNIINFPMIYISSSGAMNYHVELTANSFYIYPYVVVKSMASIQFNAKATIKYTKTTD